MGLRKIIAFVFPERCPFCGKLLDADGVACKRCLDYINNVRVPEIRGALGYRCVSTFLYKGRVRRLIIRIKYQDRVQFIRQLAALMYPDIVRYYGKDSFDLITYVPMHWIDVFARGYNQSKLLSKELSKLLGVPCIEVIVKNKRTKKQHHLKKKDRKTNLKGAFELVDKELVRGKRILVIDDIITSGYTLGECCRTISKGMPETVCCATAAASNSFTGKKSKD